MYDVIRNFGVDYIYFDIIFLAVFIFLLIKFKKKIPLIFLFVGGLINFIVDYGIWSNTGIREFILPFSFFGGALLFFIWFSLSYGVEYAWVMLMFEKKSKGKEKLLWTLLVFGGWLVIGLLSQLLPINDALITTNRHMFALRIVRLAIVLVLYAILFLMRYNWKKIVYLFLVGVGIHFMMEFSLFLTGIRPGSLLILLENSIIEFNMGVPILYIFYDKVLKRKK